MSNFIRIIMVFVLGLTLHARVLEDQSGHAVTVPDRVDRAFGLSPPMNYLLYALDPHKMIGLNFKANNKNNSASKALLGDYFFSLPVLGSFYGAGQTINLEALLKQKPQLVLVWKDGMMVDTVLKQMKHINVPSLLVPFNDIDTMPGAFKLAGDALGVHKRGEKLAHYTQKTIDHISTSLKGVKPVRYYYAEGRSGLLTECDNSFHVKALNFAGGVNVDTCKQSNLVGLERISFETLLNFNPEVIIVQDPKAYEKILTSPLWKYLKAVQKRRVYLVPHKPFNWVDRPPSFMRIIAIQWLAHIFHPQAYDININDHVKEFYQLFFNVTLTDKQIKSILGENR